MSYSVDTRTEARLQVLRNGFTPLPNVDKLCQLTGWPRVEVTEDEIRRWGRMRAFEATGLRLDNGLIAFDFDIDHSSVAELYQTLETAFPKLLGAMARGGKGYKEAWFARVDEPFPRIATPLFSYPGEEEGFRVEVFGGASNRQFGALGWHTLGEREYFWVDNRSPLNTPLDELPVFTEREVTQIVDFCTKWMTDNGFELVTEDGAGRTDPQVVYDLTPDMVFETMQDGPLGLDELRQHAGSGYYYCAASFTDGPIARNTRRCSVTVDDDDGVVIWDSMTDITHREADRAPVDIDATADQVAAGLAALGGELPTESTEYRNERVLGDYILTQDGGIRQNEANIAIWLQENRPGMLSYSDHDNMVWVMHTLADEPRHLLDSDILTIMQEAQHDLFPAAVQTKVRAAIHIAALANRHHGPRDYLRSLEWDGVGRLNSAAEDLLGVRPRTKREAAYVAAAVRKWAISAVARVMRPGCKADHMLILQGPQGSGKSSWLDVLGGQWFGDDMPPVTSKDAKQWVRYKWICEIAELGAISGKDIEHVKAFLSTRVDNYRKAYGMVDEVVPRQAIFVGSTNDEEYLMDPTGGRRFWPVKVGEIDLARTRELRDQFWAEAVVAFDAGEHWHLDNGIDLEATLGAQEAQEEARSQYPEEEPIRRWLRRQKAEDGLLSHDVMVGALDVRGGHVNPVLQHRVPRIMSMLGWVKERRTKHGALWTRGPNAQPYTPVESKAREAAEALGVKVVDGGKGENQPEAE